MNYREADAFIADIPKFTTKNKPEHTRDALRRLGNPEQDFKVIHVAGTNGKGSVCAYIESVLRRAGIKTGLFISPHLVKINERFQINGTEITDEEFLNAFHKVKHMAEQMVKEGEPHPTYFEFLFLMGMVLFSLQKVEYAILETGIGGRLDATNVVSHPVLSVITSISLDHTEILGDTLEQIAGEKAGIIKNQVPVVFEAKQECVSKVIVNKANDVGAPAYALMPSMYKILRNTSVGIDFSFESRYYGTITVFIPYIAAYQVENAALALLAILQLRELPEEEELKDKLTLEVIQSGFREVAWQGRMETILPNVVVDGAHNEDGIARFVETAIHFQKDYELTLLFSAVIEKNYEKMIETIATQIDWKTIVVTQIDGSRVVPVSELADLFRANSTANVMEVKDVEQAFEEARSRKKDGLLFCVGSLYLVGEIKDYLRRHIDD